MNLIELFCTEAKCEARAVSVLDTLAWDRLATMGWTFASKGWRCRDHTEKPAEAGLPAADDSSGANRSTSTAAQVARYADAHIDRMMRRWLR